MLPRTKGASYVPVATCNVLSGVPGKSTHALSIVDGGCSDTIIALELAQRGDIAIIQPRQESVVIETAGGVNQSVGECLLTIASLYHPNYVLSVHANVVSSLDIHVPLPPFDVKKRFGVSTDRELARQGPLEKIDILFGQDVHWQLVNTHTISPLDEKEFDRTNSVMLQESVFGWLLSGSETLAAVDTSRKTIGSAAHSSSPKDGELDKIKTEKLVSEIQQFISLDGLGVEPTAVGERKMIDEFALKHFRDTVEYIPERKSYRVSLVFSPDHPVLGDNERSAMAMLWKMEERFAADPQVHADYVAGMRKYFDAGDVEEVPADQLGKSGCFYLPHSAVLKPGSATTKVRIVFNASSKDRNGVSLNDCLLKGPNALSDILALLLRFRAEKIALMADISRMYPSIELAEADRDFLRFKWRESKSEPVRTFRHKKVGMGVADSSFLADSCIRLHAEKFSKQYPIASRIILEDRYVDDVTTGADCPDSANSLVSSLSDMMAEGNFHLRKWMSNSPEVMERIPAELRADLDHPIDFSAVDDEDTVKALGVQWNPKADGLRFRCLFEPAEQATKRTISGSIAKLYDPFGMLQPFIITAKIIFKEIWQQDTIPNN